MNVKRQSPTKPNPQALAALHDRLLWFLSQREIEKRAKQLRGRKRAARKNAGQRPAVKA